jgi:hypothetical protein
MHHCSHEHYIERCCELTGISINTPRLHIHVTKKPPEALGLKIACEVTSYKQSAVLPLSLLHDEQCQQQVRCMCCGLKHALKHEHALKHASVMYKACNCFTLAADRSLQPIWVIIRRILCDRVLTSPTIRWLCRYQRASLSV